MIWASPSHITLAIWVRVRVTGDTNITRVLGMGMPPLNVTYKPWAYVSLYAVLGGLLNGRAYPRGLITRTDSYPVAIYVFWG